MNLANEKHALCPRAAPSSRVLGTLSPGWRTLPAGSIAPAYYLRPAGPAVCPRVFLPVMRRSGSPPITPPPLLFLYVGRRSRQITGYLMPETPPYPSTTRRGAGLRGNRWTLSDLLKLRAHHGVCPLAPQGFQR